MTCIRCGFEFKQKPADHFACAEPCPLCARKYLDREIFINRANKTHNNKYNYTKVVFEYAKDTIIIICPKHGEFSQIADNHLSGNGCPECADVNNSKGCNRISEYLNANNISFVIQKTFTTLRSQKNKPLRFDFFISDCNLLIEFDGRQHSKSVSIFGSEKGFQELVENDRRKNEWVIQNGYHLIRINFAEEQQLEKILAFKLGMLFKKIHV